MYKEEKELLSLMDKTTSMTELNKAANLIILMYLARERKQATVESYHRPF